MITELKFIKNKIYFTYKIITSYFRENHYAYILYEPLNHRYFTMFSK